MKHDAQLGILPGKTCDLASGRRRLGLGADEPITLVEDSAPKVVSPTGSDIEASKCCVEDLIAPHLGSHETSLPPRV